MFWRKKAARLSSPANSCCINRPAHADRPKMAASSRVLRSKLKTSVSTLHYIGSPRSDLPPGKLPSLQDVLRVCAFRKEQPAAAKKSLESFCCHIQGTKESQCNTDVGCKTSGEPCLLYLTKLPFIEAGIVTISDYSILEKLKSSHADYKLLCRTLLSRW